VKNRYAVPGLLAAAGVGIGLALAFGGGGDDSTPPPDPAPPEPSPDTPDEAPPDADEVIDTVADLHAKWGMPTVVRDVMLAKMHQESRYHVLVMNGEVVPTRARALGVYIREASTAAQRRAAVSGATVGYDRNRDDYLDCDNPVEEYTGGAYSLLQMLPASALEAYVGTELHCISPVELFAVGPQVISGWGYMARIDDSRKAYREGGRKIGDMAVAWANPSSVGLDNEYTQAVKARFEDDLKEVNPKLSLSDAMPPLDANNNRWAGFLAEWFEMAGRLVLPVVGRR
jgi:hypothetical protein